MADTDPESDTGSYADVDGMRVYYERIGNGPKVVLLLPGGVGTGRSDFFAQLDPETGLDRSEFTLIAWDPPGYGKSRPPDRLGLYSADIYEKDARWAAELMETLKIRHYSVMGWSDGGKTALLMAILHPGRVDRLIEWGGNSYSTDRQKRALTATRDIRHWPKDTLEPYLRVYSEPEFATLWAAHVDHYNANLGDICKDRVKFIRCPSLCIQGDRDPLCDIENPAYLERNIPDCTLIRFPDGGHNLHQTCTERFNEVVTNFLLDY